MNEDKTKEVLWMGVTPMVVATERAYSLADLIGPHRMNYPGGTDGMFNYEQCKNIIRDFDVIATDQAVIDPSWEGFFCPDNWGKQLLQCKGDTWSEVLPGFSQNQEEEITPKP